MRHAIFGLVLGLLAGAGGAYLALRHEPSADPHADEHEDPALRMTAWTDRHEVFLEHPPLVAGTPARFVTHVTDLASLKPRTEGAIAYALRRGDEAPVEVEDSAPARAGIYLSTLSLPLAGEWRIAVRIDGDEVDLGTLEVHASEAAAHEAPSPQEAAGIAFLKEQQWMLGTKSEPVGTRLLVQRLRVPGIVAPRPGSRASLTAPVEGRLLPPPNRSLPAAGDRVEAGQILALVQPPFSDFASNLVEAEADTVRTQVALEQARAAEERLRRLVAEKARPERELLDAEFALRTAQANHDAAGSLRAAYAKSGAVLTESGAPAFELRSPIAGVVIQVSAAPGENVHPESPVFTVLDASRVRVEARIPEADMNRLGGTRAARFETPDAPGRLRPAGNSPAFAAAEVDPATRTVTLAYDVANEEGDLLIGTALTIYVETSRVEEAVALPESAVVDVDDRFVAFVQLGGETFEKRDLALGIRDSGFVQVREGLRAGERVVTLGAYAVRLASVATSIPAHGHSH